MHVAVFADLEGSFGIWRMRQCHTGTAEWQYGRHCLTADVNAVIQGAFDGGAQKVTVKDTHDSGFNCIIKNLDKRAQYIGDLIPGTLSAAAQPLNGRHGTWLKVSTN